MLALPDDQKQKLLELPSYIDKDTPQDQELLKCWIKKNVQSSRTRPMSGNMLTSDKKSSRNRGSRFSKQSGCALDTCAREAVER